MAGGKETPRQKMIGMMYLVLTALLALNVSKTILDAFVAIEENIQIANENEVLRGNEKESELIAKAEDNLEPQTQQKAKQLMKTVRQIDELTAKQIQNIDKLKIEILKACGEEVVQIGKQKHIVYEKFTDPLKPIRMKLEYVDGKDKYDEAMYILIGDDIAKPNETGIKLWNDFGGYRNQLTELLASSATGEGKKYYFKAPKINDYKDMAELHSRIRKAIESSNVAADDKETIAKIYASLTKQERSIVNDVKNVHWIGKTFDHAPSVAAIASLSSMQKEILTARADALALVRLRVGGGEYNFNKIMPLAYGPEVINQGEEAEIQVLMAAYDSDKQPIVKVNNGALREVREGKGYVTAKGNGNEVNLSGTITILNKSGISKTLPWEKKIRVMKPSGSISIPAYNVLYRGYDNVLVGTASGYEETTLTGSGVSLSKKGNEYVGLVNTSGRTATITVTGKNKGSGKAQALGTFTYKIMSMPKPTGFLGTLSSGTASPLDLNAMNKLFVKYGEGILINADFAVDYYEVQVGSNRSPQIRGSVITPAAKAIIRSAKKNDIVNILIRFKGKVAGFTTVSFKVT